MEPIINPWVFYLIDMVDLWRCVLGVGAGVCWFIVCINLSEGNIALRKLFLKIAISLTVVLSFVPLSSTIYKMVIADNVTPNNIQIVGDTVEDGIDYIFDKINEVVEKQEE